MKMHFLNALFPVVLLTVFCGACQTKLSGDVVITRVNIVDVVHGTIHPDNDVVIRQNRISLIRKHRSTSFQSPTVINGKDKYLIPGFWDMHVHFRGGADAIDENLNLLPLYLASGVTNVYDLGGDITPSLVKWRAEINQGARLGPTLYLCGPKLEGPSPRYSGSFRILDYPDIDSAINRLLDWHADGAKVMGNGMTQENFFHALDELHKAGLPTFVHNNFEYSSRKASAHHLSALAHMAGLYADASPLYDSLLAKSIPNQQVDIGDIIRVHETVEPSRVKELFQVFSSNQTAVISTYFNTHTVNYPDSADLLIYPSLRYVGPQIREMTIQARESYKKLPSQVRKLISLQYRNMKEGLQHLNDTHVLFLIGTDAGPLNFVPGTTYHTEMRMLVENGLTPAYVLQAATYNAAVFMKKDSIQGTVDEGKIADLLLLSGNPLDDIRQTSSIEGLLRNGRWLNKASLDSMISDLETAYGKQVNASTATSVLY